MQIESGTGKGVAEKGDGQAARSARCAHPRHKKAIARRSRQSLSLPMLALRLVTRQAITKLAPTRLGATRVRAMAAVAAGTSGGGLGRQAHPAYEPSKREHAVCGAEGGTRPARPRAGVWGAAALSTPAHRLPPPPPRPPISRPSIPAGARIVA